MELVYLWVEEYKNIQNQGFNFSPRFQCEFDGKNLTITENKDYVSIFPKNINITAIVGENGSGKSNLLDLLYVGTSPTTNYFYIFDLGNELIIKGIDINNQSSEIITNNKIKKELFIKLNPIQLNCGNFNNHIKLGRNKLSFISYSNMFSDIKNTETRCIISGEENKYNISTPYLVNYYMKHEFEMKKEIQQYYISFENQYKLFKNKNIQNSINMLKNVDIKLPISIPNKLYIHVNINKFEKESEKYLNKIDKSNLTFSQKVKTSILSNFLDYSLNELFEYKNELLGKVNIQDVTSIDDIFNSFYSVFSMEYTKEYMEKKLQINPYIKYFERAKSFVKYITNLESNIKYEQLILNISDIDISFIEDYQKLTFASLDFFHFEWFPNLSSGQENLLFQFANFYSLILDRTNKKLQDNIFIFIDEGENTLHPNWQKKYIKYLVDFFNKNFTQKMNLIFATHSPFILSDIPKENVIFLEKYKKDEDKNQKEGNCKNVSKDIDIKTFGANIHTLLSNGFFMNDGLMGEFAKSKINEAIDNLHKKSHSLTQNQIKSIIDSIGEPFLQIKLELLYKEKFGIDDEIEELQKQQESINLKIEQLKKQKSENAES
ncbi:MAG: AAA family ATPase [Aliarcobacter sp.]|jgi:predicted ATPase|nr:AAA family ATPase [Aliarcobacter sp.]